MSIVPRTGGGFSLTHPAGARTIANDNLPLPTELPQLPPNLRRLVRAAADSLSTVPIREKHLQATVPCCHLEVALPDSSMPKRRATCSPSMAFATNQPVPSQQSTLQSCEAPLRAAVIRPEEGCDMLLNADTAHGASSSYAHHQYACMLHAAHGHASGTPRRSSSGRAADVNASGRDDEDFVDDDESARVNVPNRGLAGFAMRQHGIRPPSRYSPPRPQIGGTPLHEGGDPSDAAQASLALVASSTTPLSALRARSPLYACPPPVTTTSVTTEGRVINLLGSVACVPFPSVRHAHHLASIAGPTASPRIPPLPPTSRDESALERISMYSIKQRRTASALQGRLHIPATSMAPMQQHERALVVVGSVPPHARQRVS